MEPLNSDKIKHYIRAYKHSLNNPLMAFYGEVAIAALKSASIHPAYLEKIENLEQKVNGIKDAKTLKAAQDALNDIKDITEKKHSFDSAKNTLLKLEKMIKSGNFYDNYRLETILKMAVKSVKETYRKIDFDTELMKKPEGNCFIYCDVQDLELLFYNIMINAAREMTKEKTNKGRIKIRLAHNVKEGYCTTTITNDNSYISPEGVDKINQGLDYSTTGGGEGMQIVNEVLKKYKGTKEVKSSIDPMRTEFSVCLPYSPDDLETFDRG